MSTKPSADLAVSACSSPVTNSGAAQHRRAKRELKLSFAKRGARIVMGSFQGRSRREMRHKKLSAGWLVVDCAGFEQERSGTHDAVKRLGGS